MSYGVPQEQDQIQLELYKNGPVEGAFTVYEDFLLYKSGKNTHTLTEMYTHFILRKCERTQTVVVTHTVTHRLQNFSVVFMEYSSVNSPTQLIDPPLLFSLSPGVYQHVSGSAVGGHAIKILGWGEEDGVPYWLCANSWNTDWGENGEGKETHCNNFNLHSHNGGEGNRCVCKCSYRWLWQNYLCSVRKLSTAERIPLAELILILYDSVSYTEFRDALPENIRCRRLVW